MQELLTTSLALFVAAGFIWSTVLFFAAVFLREREQDAGFGWALAGAVLFFVTFSDRLPGHSSGPHHLVTLLPGVSHKRELFASSLVALAILLLVYVFRVAVFYQLFLKDGKTIDDDGDEDIVNDVVAPALSYLCFAICAVSMLQPAYQLGVFDTLLVIVALVLIHYWPLLRWLEQYVRTLRVHLMVAWARLRRRLRRLVLQTIVLIMRLEAPRYAGGHHGLSERAKRRLEALEQEDEEARGREDDLIAAAARKSQRKSGGAKGATAP